MVRSHALYPSKLRALVGADSAKSHFALPGKVRSLRRTSFPPPTRLRLGSSSVLVRWLSLLSAHGHSVGSFAVFGAIFHCTLSAPSMVTHIKTKSKWIFHNFCTFRFPVFTIFVSCGSISVFVSSKPTLFPSHHAVNSHQLPICATDLLRA